MLVRMVGYITSLSRVEVSLFVLSPEIEDQDEVEVGNWAKHKKTFYSEFYDLKNQVNPSQHQKVFKMLIQLFS
jgi:hypothetical protein